MASALVAEYSSAGSTILEPFSGSGVVALEALLQGRNIIANDISPYAAVLTRAKLLLPPSEALVIEKARQYCLEAKLRAKKRHWRVDAPTWVKQFFHPRTLAETLALAEIFGHQREWFLLACLLGILHHQRPGFLSYPSSHLVPYLRRKKFPKKEYRALYRYRDAEPRLIAKIHRAYRRVPDLPGVGTYDFLSRPIDKLRIKQSVDLLLTSPPYMNALDYGRDNRLRLWFLGVPDYRALDSRNCRNQTDFAELIGQLADLADSCLSRQGRVVLVIGEVRRKSQQVNTAAIVEGVFSARGRFRLIDHMEDPVPDIRRGRRGCTGTKREWILVFSRKLRAIHGHERIH